MGIDTIYYGKDLWDWMRADNFVVSGEVRADEARYIEFWSELVYRYETFNVHQVF